MIARPSSDCCWSASENVNCAGVRAWTQDLWQDLREVTRKIRPDWDLSKPGLRENWEGDKTMHYPSNGRKKIPDPLLPLNDLDKEEAWC